MPFTIARFDQVDALCNNLHEHSYHLLDKAVKKNRCLGFVATLIIETTLAVALVAATIGSLVECVFKGIIHIIGSPCSKRCQFEIGFQTLTYNLIFNTLQVPSKIFQSIYDIPRNTIRFLANSKNYAATNHLKYHIPNLQRALTDDPTNLKLLQELDRISVLPEEEIAHRFSVILKAASLKDSLYMRTLTFSYCEQRQKMDKKLFELFSKRANEQDLASTFMLAWFHRDGIGTEPSQEKFGELLKICVDQNFVPAMDIYADHLIRTGQKDNIFLALNYLKICFRMSANIEFAITIQAILEVMPSLNTDEELSRQVAALSQNQPEKLAEMKALIQLANHQLSPNRALPPPPRSPLRITVQPPAP